MQNRRRAALLSKFDRSLSGLGSVTLRRPAAPGGHIYLAHMHITQASVSLLHLLEGPRLRGRRPGPSSIPERQGGHSAVPTHAQWAKPIMTGVSLKGSSLRGEAGSSAQELLLHNRISGILSPLFTSLQHLVN